MLVQEQSCSVWLSNQKVYISVILHFCILKQLTMILTWYSVHSECQRDCKAFSRGPIVYYKNIWAYNEFFGWILLI